MGTDGEGLCGDREPVLAQTAHASWGLGVCLHVVCSDVPSDPNVDSWECFPRGYAVTPRGADVGLGSLGALCVARSPEIGLRRSLIMLKCARVCAGV